MTYIATFQQSNTASWIFDVTATDADTGADIDFSTATAISFVVGDSNNCPLLTASLANGKITLPTSNTIEVSFSPGDLQTLCQRTYGVGMTYVLNGETNQILTGSVSIYDGLAKL